MERRSAGSGITFLSRSVARRFALLLQPVLLMLRPGRLSPRRCMSPLWRRMAAKRRIAFIRERDAALGAAADIQHTGPADRHRLPAIGSGGLTPGHAVSQQPKKAFMFST